jgi:4-nitrophenyl phosphatase
VDPVADAADVTGGTSVTVVTAVTGVTGVAGMTGRTHAAAANPPDAAQAATVDATDTTHSVDAADVAPSTVTESEADGVGPLDPAVVLCDLDGVIWLSHVPIPGSVEAVARLRAAGRRVVFVTNNSSAVIADQEAALAAVGIPAAGDVLTSAMAAAALVGPGERVLVCGGPGISEALGHRGAIAVPGDDPDGVDVDVVMVGFHRTFDYERMRIAATAAMRGARLIATNDDATYPTPDGPIPGGGSILAAVVTASGRQPVVAGKPYAPMADAVRAIVGDVSTRRVLVVGDRASTDGEFAVTLACPFALVRSGVTRAGDRIGVPVAIDVPDLAAVVDTLRADHVPG